MKSDDKKKQFTSQLEKYKQLPAAACMKINGSVAMFVA